MKTMPRVATFLNLILKTGAHSVFPNEQERKAAKKQPKVCTMPVYLTALYSP